jgi:hypothetical protein
VTNDKQVTDVRLLKVFSKFGSQENTDMIYDGRIYSCEEDEIQCEIFNKQLTEIPANSLKFVAITTHGQLKLPVPEGRVLVVEPDISSELEVLVTPGVSKVREKKAYCCILNPTMKRVKIEEGTKLGNLTLVTTSQVLPLHAEQGEVNQVEKRVTESNSVRKQIIQELKITDNPRLQGNPELRERIVQLFFTYSDIISRNEFDYGHTTAIQCQIQLKPGKETPVKLKARPLNPAQEESLRKQVEEWEDSGIVEKTQSPWAFPMVGVKKKNSTSIRWCVDYRLLNQKTVKDAYPLASIETNFASYKEPESSPPWTVRELITQSRSILSRENTRLSRHLSDNINFPECLSD